MKKKLLGFVLVFAVILTAAMFFTACRGNDYYKVSLQQFNDDGIAMVSLNYAKKSDYENKGEQSLASVLPYSLSLYSNYPEKTYNIQEVDKNETYYGMVCLQLQRDYVINDVKVSVNGVELEVFAANDYYWAEVGEFSSDLDIKLKGQTKIKTWSPSVELVKYEENKNSVNCQNLRFTVSVATEKENYQGEIYVGKEEAFDYTTFTHNGKSKFTLAELKEAMDNGVFTYRQHLEIAVSFENGLILKHNGEGDVDEFSEVFSGDYDIALQHSNKIVLQVTMGLSLNSLKVNCDKVAQITSNNA